VSHPLPILLGSVINAEYQSGGDVDTLRSTARAIRAVLPEPEREALTDAVEMSGLWLDSACACGAGCTDGSCTAQELGECDGHPAGPFDPMGQTVYCDGSCA
jgi:hypothetical protein